MPSSPGPGLIGRGRERLGHSRYLATNKQALLHSSLESLLPGERKAPCAQNLHPAPGPLSLGGGCTRPSRGATRRRALEEALGGVLPGCRVGPLHWQSRGGKRWWAQHHPESPPARHKKPHCKVHPHSEALVAGWRPPQTPGQFLTPGKPGLRNYVGNGSQRPAEGKPDASAALEGGALWAKPSLLWNILPLAGGPPCKSLKTWADFCLHSLLLF